MEGQPQLKVRPRRTLTPWIDRGRSAGRERSVDLSGAASPVGSGDSTPPGVVSIEDPPSDDANSFASSSGRYPDQPSPRHRHAYQRETPHLGDPRARTGPLPWGRRVPGGPGGPVFTWSADAHVAPWPDPPLSRQATL